MNKEQIRKLLVTFGIPIVALFVFVLIFSLDSFRDFLSEMIFAFIFLTPVIAGILTVYLSSLEKASKLLYRLFCPWIPILIFFFLTLFLNMEGWACWLMVLPVFLISASIGGLIGGYLKVKKSKKR